MNFGTCVVSVLALTLGWAHAAGRRASGGADPQLAELRSAVDAGNARYAEGMRRGDAAAVASVFTDDAVVVHPAAAGILRGRAAIEEFNRGRLATGKFDAVLITASLERYGDLALETGTYQLSVQAPGAEPARRTGRYLVVWRKEGDGNWRICADAPVPDPSR